MNVNINKKKLFYQSLLFNKDDIERNVSISIASFIMLTSMTTTSFNICIRTNMIQNKSKAPP